MPEEQKEKLFMACEVIVKEEQRKNLKNLNVGEKTLLRAVQSVTRLPLPVIKGFTIKFGDIGSATEHLLEKQKKLKKISDL